MLTHRITGYYLIQSNSSSTHILSSDHKINSSKQKTQYQQYENLKS